MVTTSILGSKTAVDYSSSSLGPMVEYNRGPVAAASYVHGGSITQDTPTVYSCQGDLQRQPKSPFAEVQP